MTTEREQSALDESVDQYSTEELESIVSALAKRRSDGHYTLLKFTTGYKAVLGTPDVWLDDRETIWSLPTAVTARQALVDLLSRELNERESLPTLIAICQAESLRRAYPSRLTP